MWWMGEWSYRLANSSSRISSWVTATFRALRYRWFTRTMPWASSCCSGVPPWGIWMSLSRMVPLFSIIMKKLRLLVIGSLIVMIITYSYDGCVNKLQNSP